LLPIFQHIYIAKVARMLPKIQLHPFFRIPPTAAYDRRANPPSFYLYYLTQAACDSNLRLNAWCQRMRRMWRIP